MWQIDKDVWVETRGEMKFVWKKAGVAIMWVQVNKPYLDDMIAVLDKLEEEYENSRNNNTESIPEQH